MRVVGVHPVGDKRESGQHLRQWRVLDVQPHVQLLEIAHPGADVGYFINCDRLLPRCAAREYRHECEE